MGVSIPRQDQKAEYEEEVREQARKQHPPGFLLPTPAWVAALTSSVDRNRNSVSSSKMLQGESVITATEWEL